MPPFLHTVKTILLEEEKRFHKKTFSEGQKQVLPVSAGVASPSCLHWGLLPSLHIPLSSARSPITWKEKGVNILPAIAGVVCCLMLFNIYMLTSNVYWEGNLGIWRGQVLWSGRILPSFGWCAGYSCTYSCTCVSQIWWQWSRHGLVSSWLDYCNALYMGLSLKMVWAASAECRWMQVTGIRWAETVISLLQQLRWLPVYFWAQFQGLAITFKFLYSKRPGCFKDVLPIHSSSLSAVIRDSPS